MNLKPTQREGLSGFFCRRPVHRWTPPQTLIKKSTVVVRLSLETLYILNPSEYFNNLMRLIRKLENERRYQVLAFGLQKEKSFKIPF